MENKSNHLISEKSPYLIAHANNPVDWYPWKETVFDKAKKEDKPIFLSIGYSACHWCHVMEKESFEDIEVANALNEMFISIKVDREERPDIDKIYMDFCQMMTGSGGWPLTIIMTPEKKPFFAATYIPKHNKYGRIGILELIEKIKELWFNNRKEILKSSENILNYFLDSKNILHGELPDKKIIDLTFDNLAKQYDISNGGFGSAPKFPASHKLQFLLRYWKNTGNEFAMQMVEKTLNSMYSGGIWDHIGFGFHRYSTDENWAVPHFEKMLYDQALISSCCIEVFQATGNENYKNLAEEIFKYVLREMTSSQGGFYSSQDADSEGIEGKFYFWNINEIQSLFTEKESEIVIDYFNIGSRHSEDRVLILSKSEEEAAAKYGLSLEEFNKIIKKAKNIMFQEREKRIPPFKDDKILTDWNGLMISSLARGAIVFNNKDYEKAASNSAFFIIENLITDKGELLHRYRENESAINGTLDDYAFFISGLIDLYETTFDVYFLKNALKLNKYLIENFWDNENGGFYFSQKDNELSIFRKKDAYDGAIPSGNSIALLNLIKLSKITSDPFYEEKAIETLKAFSKIIEKSPEAYAQLLSSFDFYIGPSIEIVVVGDISKKESKNIIKTIYSKFIPNKIVVFKNTASEIGQISDIANYTKDMEMLNNHTTVYICSGYSCKAPINNVNKLIKLLS